VAQCIQFGRFLATEGIFGKEGIQIECNPALLQRLLDPIPVFPDHPQIQQGLNP
jgi:hypothetical protein